MTGILQQCDIKIFNFLGYCQISHTSNHAVMATSYQLSSLFRSALTFLQSWVEVWKQSQA
uniref:Uncharacterized protein n=1 Tax=Anguilla anguilla TaxID=7936 RepID=A0A0E9TRW4_ANGAN